MVIRQAAQKGGAGAKDYWTKEQGRSKVGQGGGSNRVNGDGRSVTQCSPKTYKKRYLQEDLKSAVHQRLIFMMILVGDITFLFLHFSL
jgi:hypothetical protein